MNLYVKHNELSRVGEELGTISKKMTNIKGDLEDVKSSLAGMSAYASVNSVISRIVVQVEEEIKTTSLFGDTLREISNLYSQTEKAITKERIKTNSREENSDTSSGNSSEESIAYTSGSGHTYHIGEPQQPEFEADNDFAYDPNEKPTWEDYLSWLKWETIEEIGPYGAPILGRDMPDAFEAYSHYREGNGEDLEIDYAKAYQEDANIQAAVDNYINETQAVVEQMIADGQTPPFSITSDLMPIGNNGDYPCTENWQKTVGAHHIWISADVTVDENGNISMDTTVHEIDRYNFNAGMPDIASGTPDDVNGRFEQLGWAHSYNTTGEVSFDVQWQQGHIETAQTEMVESGRN